MMKSCMLFRIIVLAVLLSSCSAPLAYTGRETETGKETLTEAGKKSEYGNEAAGSESIVSPTDVTQYIDLQEKELRQSYAIQKDPIIQRSGNILAVTFGSDSLFGVNSNVLRPGAYDRLSHLTALLKKYPKTRVTVNGYTDSSGSEAHNLKLSESRAAAVKHALVSDGIPASRVVSSGLGETQFVASNATEAGRERNRRICIVITPDAN